MSGQPVMLKLKHGFGLHERTTWSCRSRRPMPSSILVVICFHDKNLNPKEYQSICIAFQSFVPVEMLELTNMFTDECGISFKVNCGPTEPTLLLPASSLAKYHFWQSKIYSTLFSSGYVLLTEEKGMVLANFSHWSNPNLNWSNIRLVTVMTNAWALTKIISLFTSISVYSLSPCSAAISCSGSSDP